MPAQKPVAVEGGPVWIGLTTHDVGGAIAFYSQLLGWEFPEGNPEFGGYRVVLKDGLPVAGAMTSLSGPEGPTEKPQAPTNWTVYLRTDDIEARCAAVTEHGGQLLIPPMPVGDLGSMAVLSDPAGAVVGLWQPDTFDGLEICATLGAPVWFETMTKDFDAASVFYRDALEWDLHAMPGDDADFRYVTHGTGERTAAGMCDAAGFLPDDVDSYWRVYFGVANLDESLAQVDALGGALLDGPVDSPWGRLATVADPQGASFQLLEIPAQYH